MQRINIIQGERCVVKTPDTVISTLLGSCVAACLFDPVAHVGGMNHFLLPEPGAGPCNRAELEHYGIHAMELLINDMMKQGAQKHRLRAHLYGGANIMSGLRSIGSSNAAFAREFMRTEGIPISHERLGGTQPLKVEFQPYDGRARAQAVEDIPAVPKTTRPVHGGEIELF